MLNRILLPVLLLFAPAAAQDAGDPAAAMPAETLAYAEFDANALHEGFLELDVVKALFSEEYKNFFGPILADMPVEDLKSMKPVKDWIAGRAAAGLCGLKVRLRGFDGTYETVRIAPGGKVDARLLNLLWRADLAGGGPDVILDPEVVAVVEPGKELRAWLDGFLAEPPVKFEHKFVQRGARQILTLKFEPFMDEGFWYAPEIHADLTGDRWVVATSAELLKSARTSLAEDPAFMAARARHTSGRRVIFAYADMARAMSAARPFLPEVLRDALALNGLSSVRNVALGISMVDGGVRESYGIGLEENPGGVWRLLEAFPRGLKSIHKFPKQALGVVAVKFDPKAFDGRFREVAGALMPGFEDIARDAWAAAALELGIQYETEILPAFGDEFAIAFYPGAGIVPGMLLGADLRDEPAFAALMGKLQGALGNGPVRLRDTDEEGWKLSGALAAELRVHDGHLLGSTSGAILRRTIAEWEEPAATIAKDAEIFRRVMKAMNGGDTGNLVALAYGDIRHWLPTLLTVGAATGAFDHGPFNPNPMPDAHKLAKRFTGLAIAVRRNEKGLVLESFGPVGTWSLLAPAFLFTARGGMAPVPIR